MVNYSTLLKTWGDTGAEHPTGYSYQEGEQPVDGWDNFVTHNIIKDLNHLISTTNNDLVERSGGEITSDLSVGTNSLVGSAGNIDFSGGTISLEGSANVFQDLSVGGSLSVSGNAVATETWVNSQLPHDHTGEDISPNTVTVGEKVQNAIYDTIADIPASVEQEGAQVYTRSDGFVVFQS